VHPLLSTEVLGVILTPLVLLGIVAASWALRSGTRALAHEAPAAADSVPHGEFAGAKG
jgi:hypothetical protein